MADAPTTSEPVDTSFTFTVTDPDLGTLTWTPGPHPQGHLVELEHHYDDPQTLQAEGEAILADAMRELVSSLCITAHGIQHSALLQAALSSFPSDDPYASDVEETLAMFAELGIPVIEVGQMGAFDQGMSELIADLIAQRPAAATDE